MKASARTRTRGARPIFWRLVEIHQVLDAGACPSIDDFAGRFEVSPRTIQRDIEQFRNCGAPVVFDRSRGGYRYTRKFSLPRMSLTAGELTVLLIGQRILTELAGTPLIEDAQQVMQKLPSLLGGEVSVDLDHFSRNISFGLPKVRGEHDAIERYYKLLSEAITQCRTVRMKYYAPTSGETTHREVNPYHLRLEAGAWYLFGYCHMRDEIRIFAVDRIQDLELTEHTFPKPTDFSIQDYLGHSWGIEHGREYTVRVAFDEEQARWIRERDWLEGQMLTDLPDGGVILEVKVSGLFSIMRWILGFGGHAEVLDPPELQAAVQKEAEKILAHKVGNVIL